jgi:hypothetical protein
LCIASYTSGSVAAKLLVNKVSWISFVGINQTSVEK